MTGVWLALAGATGWAASPVPDSRSVLPINQPKWAELSTFQQETLAPLQSAWNGLPAAKKRSWLALTEKMPAMNPADRAAAQQRIREWAALSPEQRRMARDNYRLAKSLDRDERLATWESYQQMTPEQRSVLRANGWTSNTAARHAGAPTGLAKEAARPLASAQQPKTGSSARAARAAAPAGQPADGAPVAAD
ncbi:MAG: DUF3106 domain-containing protein [Betaproteobacteria bacterium]|nr:DUF3106 domain-containing protein [Betaproteobacteria bacterium]